jgi:hypothetical protein
MQPNLRSEKLNKLNNVPHAPPPTERGIPEIADLMSIKINALAARDRRKRERDYDN